MPTPAPAPMQRSDAVTPVPPVPPVAQAPAAANEALLAQYRALTEQLAGLQAQRTVLRRLTGSPQGNVAVSATEQLAKVEAQIAKVSVDQADLAGRLGAVPGQPIVRPPFNPPNYNRRPGMDSGDVTAIFLTFILAVLMPISIGFTRRMLRRAPKETGTAAADTIAPRLDRLEQAVDAIAIEIERIAEGQRFVTKVMTERPATATVRPSLDPADPIKPALEEGKPFLALGAGPIEPIRVAERQAVRQSITPH